MNLTSDRCQTKSSLEQQPTEIQDDSTNYQCFLTLRNIECESLIVFTTLSLRQYVAVTKHNHLVSAKNHEYTKTQIYSPKFYTLLLHTENIVSYLQSKKQYLNTFSLSNYITMVLH